MINLVEFLNESIIKIVSSVVIVCLLWLGLYIYGVWVSNQRHKEIIDRLERIEQGLK